MGSLFKSTENTRALLCNSLRYVRSDAPDKLSESEIQWLLDRNITTIIDLRGPTETRSRPCVLEHRDGFSYFNLPVTGGGIIPCSIGEVSQSYIKMVDEAMCT